MSIVGEDEMCGWVNDRFSRVSFPEVVTTFSIIDLPFKRSLSLATSYRDRLFELHNQNSRSDLVQFAVVAWRHLYGSLRILSNLSVGLQKTF